MGLPCGTEVLVGFQGGSRRNRQLAKKGHARGGLEEEEEDHNDNHE